MTIKSKTKRVNSTKQSSTSTVSSPITSTKKASPTLTPFVRRFLRRVQNTVSHHALWHDGESFIVGVSGGPDSLCLLDVLMLLSQKHRFTLHVAHVNYRLRDSASDQDEALVRHMAQHYHLPISILHPKPTSTQEERLRDIRYRFFERLRKKYQAGVVAIAHHEDDQAETLLLRLLRGSGLRGLSAMRPKHGTIIRPLLDIPRTDILRYLKERKITARTDESNFDTRYLRNRIRHELLPLLEGSYQKNISHLLATTATLLASDYAFLEAATSSAPLPKTFSLLTLQNLSETELRQHFRTLLFHLQGRFPGKGLVDEILKLVRSTKNKHQTLILRDLKVTRKGDTVTLFLF